MKIIRKIKYRIHRTQDKRNFKKPRTIESIIKELELTELDIIKINKQMHKDHEYLNLARHTDTYADLYVKLFSSYAHSYAKNKRDLKK